MFIQKKLKLMKRLEEFNSKKYDYVLKYKEYVSGRRIIEIKHNGSRSVKNVYFYGTSIKWVDKFESKVVKL